MGKLTAEVFNESCCDGGSAAGYGWVPKEHGLNTYKVGEISDEEIEKALGLPAVEEVTDHKPSNPKDLIGSDKLPLDLVPGTTKAYLALGHLEGHLKYGLVNWREAGVKTSIYLAALERHIEKYKNGEWEDPKTQIPHLANALACLSIIVDAYESGKLIDDRPKSAPVAALIDKFSDKVKHLKKLFGNSKPIDYFISGPKQRE